MEPKIDALISKTIQFISNQSGEYDSEPARHFIQTELASLDTTILNSYSTLIIQKFKNVGFFYQDTVYWNGFHSRNENTHILVQFKIRKNIIRLLIDLADLIPNINFKEIIRELGTYNEFLRVDQFQYEAELRKVILEFLLKQTDKDILPYIEKYFAMNSTNELAAITDVITRNTHFKEEVLNMILQIANQIIDKFPENEKRNVARHLWTGLYRLVEGQPTLGRILVEKLIIADPSLQELLRNAITMCGTLPECSSRICELLIDYLISDNISFDLKNVISRILDDIIKTNPDPAIILALIADKAKKMAETKKQPLIEFLNLISKIAVEKKAEWREIVEMIIEKIDMGSHIALQKTYIENELKHRSLTTVLHDFTNAFKSFENTRRGTIGQLRPAYEGLIEALVRQKGGTPTGNTKDDLKFLETQSILKETPTNRPDPNLEFNFSYKLYGLLSYYGMHPSPAPPEIIFTVFIETVSWIYLLLKRSE